MNTTLMLADSAQAVNGKLFILGGGWTDTPLGPDGLVAPQALAILIQVPWDQANRPHHLRLRLLTADGHPFRVSDGPSVQIDTDFETGRPPGTHPGVTLPVPLALNISPMPLPPGRYAWELTVDEELAWTTQVAFTVRPMPVAVG